jgi:hypothetical protein
MALLLLLLLLLCLLLLVGLSAARQGWVCPGNLGAEYPMHCGDL